MGYQANSGKAFREKKTRTESCLYSGFAETGVFAEIRGFLRIPAMKSIATCCIVLAMLTPFPAKPVLAQSALSRDADTGFAPKPIKAPQKALSTTALLHRWQRQGDLPDRFAHLEPSDQPARDGTR